MTLIDELKQKVDNRTKPKGSLGKLERLAIQIGLIQNTTTPKLCNPTIIVFAADHGISEEGVSPCPKEITYQMVNNFANGGAGINVFSRQNGIKLRIVDSGVDYDFQNDKIENLKIARGTKNMLHEPAMTIEQCNKAIGIGAKCVFEEYNKGCNVIGFGEMGIANTSSASLLLHRLAGIPLVECIGRGSGLDDKGLLHKIDVLTKVSDNYGEDMSVIETLATFGGFEIAMICGAVLEAKRLGMIIVADGFITSSAFLVAYSIDSSLMDNVIFSHQSKESGHKAMLQYMGGEPLLDLDLRLGEGTGVALAYPIIKSAVVFLNEMSSFDDAKVFQVHK